MRDSLRRIVNGALSVAGVKLVSQKWGPRGFGESLKRVRAAGIEVPSIVDVGAAGGAWTRECLEIFPDANYLLVDPLKENVTALASQEGGDVKVWNGALGAEAGSMVLHAQGDQSSFLKSEFDARGELRTVEVRTLDSFLGTPLLPAPPRLIKADVQGYELEVLKGAQDCLGTAELVLLEVSFRRVYAGCPLAHEVIAYLGEKGFRVYDICSYMQRPRDGELVQADMLFAREGSRLFSFEGYV